MTRLHHAFLASLMVVVAAMGQAAAPAPKATVVVLATGGTIAGAAASSTQAGYTSGQVGVQAMLSSVAGLDKLANLRGEQIANVGSQDMSFAIMLKLANRINQLLATPEVNGVVVTHGTDTMEETAYFLNLTVKSDKPVVLVGSMRPSTALSADGPLNLYNAVSVAADPNARGRGVLVEMNDWIHGARSLIKTSTTDVQTFMSPLRGLIGISAYGKNEFYNTPAWKHTNQTEFDVSQVTTIPRVDIIYVSADMSPDLIEASVASGAKGIVIAGVGNGNMNKAALEAAAEAAKKGVVVVRSSRVLTGNVSRDVEVDDDQYGFVASYGLNPQKSRILLSLALLQPHSVQEIQTMFRTY